MMKKESLIDLYIHMEWADNTVWSKMPVDNGEPPDARLHDLLFHTHFTQRAFLRVWTGQPVDRYDPTRFSTLADIREWATPYYPEAHAFLTSLGRGRLREPVEVPWATMFKTQLGGEPASVTLGETVLQVALHSTYHRGQINARLRELGEEPPLVDYISWVWRGRPAPETE